MGTPPKPPPPNPTSSGSSETTPKNPGAAAPGPTSPGQYVYSGDDAPSSPAEDLKKWKKRARECGGVIRLDRK